MEAKAQRKLWYVFSCRELSSDSIKLNNFHYLFFTFHTKLKAFDFDNPLLLIINKQYKQKEGI